MSERGGRLATNNGGRFVDELVIGQRVDHEEREVDPASEVALQHRVSDVATP